MAKLSHAVCLTLLLCAAPANAQTAARRPPADCEAEKAAILELASSRRPRGMSQREAYELSKEFVRKCGGDDKDPIVFYVRRWVEKYEAAVRDYEARRAAAAAAQTDEQAKAELYRRSGPTPKMTPQQRRAAYELGKEYLRTYGRPEDEDILRYVRPWVLKYEAEMRAAHTARLLKRQAGARAVCRRGLERGLE